MDRDGENLSVDVRVLNPVQARELLPRIAALRIRVFREFPYIYDGSESYEVKYLGRYFKAPDARFVGAFSASGEMIGAATCLPLAQEENFVQSPFREAGFKPEEVFYFGESVLLPEYRGQGVGHRFFDEREKIARIHNCRYTAFCAVARAEDHPLRPAVHRPLDEFWKGRGYEKHTELRARFSWKELNEAVESEKEMVYWLKRWP